MAEICLCAAVGHEVEVCCQFLLQCLKLNSGQWTSSADEGKHIVETVLSPSAIYGSETLKNSTVYNWYNHLKTVRSCWKLRGAVVGQRHQGLMKMWTKFLPFRWKVEKQLVLAPWQRALSNLLRSVAVFGEEPNPSHPPANIFSISHSMQLLTWGERSLFCFSRRKSTANLTAISKRTPKGASSNGSTTGTSVYVCKGSTKRVTRLGFICPFLYKLCISSRNILVLPCISWTKDLMVNAWLMVWVLLTNSVLFHGCSSGTGNCKGPAFNQTFYSFIIQYMNLKSFPNVNKNVCFE